MNRVPRLDPTKYLLHLRDRTLVMRRDNPQSAFTAIHSPEPEDLERIVAAVDGVRTLQQVCDVLSAHYEADDVVQIIEKLAGKVFIFSQPASDARARRRDPIHVVGASQLAIDLAAALAETGPVTLVKRAEFARVLADSQVLVAVHDGSVADAIAINRAVIAAGTTCIHVYTEPDTLVLGPTTLPFKTVCFECSLINRHFENHAADGAAVALARLSFDELAPPHVRACLAVEAADWIARELASLAEGTPYPRLLGSQYRISLAKGTQEVELAPTANCESCFGCNRHGIRVGLGDALPDPPRLERRPLIEDRAGSVRSVAQPEAIARIETAMNTLGVSIDAKGFSKRVLSRFAPLAGIGFCSVDDRLTFRRDAELVMARPPAPCFGKGATPQQTMCSGMFEYLERTLQMYRGGLDIVRAPYADVREHAVDMHAFTAGLLDIPDRGHRVIFDPQIEIDWLWGRCLRTGRPMLIPAHALYPAIFATAERHPSFMFRGGQIEMPRRSSSGLAAGATLEDAVLQGFYEILEHDARLIQNRTGITAPKIDLASIDDPLTKQMIDLVERAGFELQLRYLSRDIQVPVVEAYVRSRVDLTFYCVPGWGAHHDPAIAIRRAVTETAQCVGAVESVASQTFLLGQYSATNSFHEYQYCKSRVEGTIGFHDLPRPDPKWSSTLDYVQGAVRSITAVLPNIDLVFYEYPGPGLANVNVARVFHTQLVGCLHMTHFLQDRVRNVGGKPIPFEQLFVGDIKL